MIRKHYKTILITTSLVVYSLIMLVPPLIHGYIYPTMGDDSGVHLEVMKYGYLWTFNYYAYVVLGYPLRGIESLIGLSINSMFMWFNFLVLVGVGLTFYFVLSRLVNRKAGLFALIIPIFLSRGVLIQYDFGMVFNIINFSIILPWLIYFAIKWAKERRLHQLLLSLFFACGFGLFHNTGIYMVPLAIGILGILYGHRIFIKKQKYTDYALTLFLSGIAIIGVVTQYLLVNPQRFEATNKVVIGNELLRSGYPISVILPIVVFIGMIVGYVLSRRKRIFGDYKYVFVFLGVAVVNLAFMYLIMKEESYYIVIGLTRGVYSGSGQVLPWQYVMAVVCPATVIIFALSALFIDKRKSRLLSYETKSLQLVFILMVAMLGVLCFGGLSKTPDRMLFDMTTSLALLTAVLAAIAWDGSSDKVWFMDFSKRTIIRYAVLGFIIISLILNLPNWFGYRSVVKNPDMQAIAYVNSLSCTTYNCSTEIAPIIYNQFTKAQYHEYSEEVLIARNMVMTPGSDKNSRAYFGFGTDTTDGFTLDRVFSEGELEVRVYIGELGKAPTEEPSTDKGWFLFAGGMR